MANSNVLQEKKDELNKILENYSQWSQVEIWIAGVTSIIKLQFPDYFEEFNRYCKEPSWTSLLPVIKKRKYSLEQGEFTRLPPNSSLNDLNRDIQQTSNLKKGQNAIQKLLNFLDTLIQLNSSELIFNDNDSEDVLTILERIFSRFHRINLQLQNRYSGRPTIQINDEHDVQNLLHALLNLYFDDIRPEEFTNSSAGRNSRTDFLLKREEVMIEAKRTRQGLKETRQIIKKI